MNAHRLGAVLGAVVLVAALAACSSAEPRKAPFETIRFPAETAPVAVPGQTLALGDVVLLPAVKPDGSPADQIETAVIAVVKGKPTYWDRFENGDEFEGDIPYFTVVQYRWVSGEVAASSTPVLLPVATSGEVGGYVRREYFGSAGADTACPFEIPRFDLEKDRERNEYLQCTVLTLPQGSTIAGVQWQDIPRIGFGAPDPEVYAFYENPLVWAVSAGD